MEENQKHCRYYKIEGGIDVNRELFESYKEIRNERRRYGDDDFGFGCNDTHLHVTVPDGMDLALPENAVEITHEEWLEAY